MNLSTKLGIVGLLLAAPFAGAQSPANVGLQAATKWNTECNENYCILSTRISISDSDHPADPEHPEYIGVGVDFTRKDLTPYTFNFFVPPDADRNQGVLIDFAKSVKEHGERHVKPDKGDLSQLDFTNCDENFCVARIHPQILDSNGKVSMDLLERFLHRDFVYFLFKRDGQIYRALGDLSPFQDAYKHLHEAAKKPSAN